MRPDRYVAASLDLPHTYRSDPETAVRLYEAKFSLEGLATKTILTKNQAKAARRARRKNRK